MSSVRSSTSLGTHGTARSGAEPKMWRTAAWRGRAGQAFVPREPGVDLLHVPGGQVAGMLSEEKSARPAKEIVERMVEEAAQILNNIRSQYVGA